MFWNIGPMRLPQPFSKSLYMSLSASFTEDKIYQSMLNSFSWETRWSISQCEGKQTENGNFRLHFIFSLCMIPTGFHPHPSVEDLGVLSNFEARRLVQKTGFFFVVQKRLVSGCIFHNSKILTLAMLWQPFTTHCSTHGTALCRRCTDCQHLLNMQYTVFLNS